MLNVERMSIKENNNLKREVKKVTGKNMKDITILSFGSSFIQFGYYATNYDRVTNNMTKEEITR